MVCCTPGSGCRESRSWSDVYRWSHMGSPAGNTGSRSVAHHFEFRRCGRRVLDSQSYSIGRWEHFVGEMPELRQTPLLFFCDSCQSTQIAGTPLTEMEAVSAGAGITCIWDELAQDWGR